MVAMIFQTYVNQKGYDNRAFLSRDTRVDDTVPRHVIRRAVPSTSYGNPFGLWTLRILSSTAPSAVRVLHNASSNQI